MLRDTMIRTIPVAMIAIDVLWTERFQRLRAVCKSPPDSTLNAIQMTARATTMPSRRVSNSVATRNERQRRSRGGVGVMAGLGLVPSPAGASVSVNVHARGVDQQLGTEPAFTPLHTLSLVAQPASITTARLSVVIGCGWRRIDETSLPPGVLNASVPFTLLTSLSLHSATADSPAVLPSSRASFQTLTACVPSATRLRAAWSPS